MSAISPGPSDYQRALDAAGLSEITLVHHQSTGSTNDDARALVAGDAPLQGTGLVVAETQTKGRGRGGNVWLSPQGSISFTLTVPNVEASRLGALPLGAGACVASALRHLGAAAAVKWPNDVLIAGDKVSGILCESSLLSGTARVFIGVGINVEGLPAGNDLLAHATTLEAHGIDVDRPTLVLDIASRVLALIRGGRSGAAMVEDFKAVAVPWWGEAVTFVEGESERRVTLLDVNPLGQLVVRDEGGVVRSLVSGEVRQLRTGTA